MIRINDYLNELRYGDLVRDKITGIEGYAYNIITRPGAINIRIIHKAPTIHQLIDAKYYEMPLAYMEIVERNIHPKYASDQFLFDGSNCELMGTKTKHLIDSSNTGEIISINNFINYSAIYIDGPNTYPTVLSLDYMWDIPSKYKVKPKFVWDDINIGDEVGFLHGRHLGDIKMRVSGIEHSPVSGIVFKVVDEYNDTIAVSLASALCYKTDADNIPSTYRVYKPSDFKSHDVVRETDTGRTFFLYGTIQTYEQESIQIVELDHDNTVGSRVDHRVAHDFIKLPKESAAMHKLLNKSFESKSNGVKIVQFKKQ